MHKKTKENLLRNHQIWTGLFCLSLVASSLGQVPAAPADKDTEQVDVITPQDDEDPGMTAAEKKHAAKRKAIEERRKKQRIERDKANKAAAIAAAAQAAKNSVQICARVVSMTPVQPVNIGWRWGGEGLGGSVHSGAWGKELKVGQWTEPVALTSLSKSAKRTFFLTVTVAPLPFTREDKRAGKKAPPPVEKMAMEFDFSFAGKSLKTFKVDAPDGATAGLAIPSELWIGGEEATQETDAIARLGGVEEYAMQRLQAMQKLPWSAGPLPQHYTLLTDLGGYGEGAGRGIRQSDKAVVNTELQTLRQLGVNGLRAMPNFVLQDMKDGKGYGDFNRGLLIHAMGYPVPNYRKGRAEDPEAGCPYEVGVPERIRVGVESSLQEMLAMPAENVWGLTDDEIGSVFDRAPEGKAHMALHDKDIRAYQQFLQAKGLKPQQFGATDWSQVKPVNLWNRDKNAPKPNYDDPHVGLNVFYTRHFNNYSSAKLFTPLRDALSAANERKRAALAAGEKDSAAAKQPWVFSYSLRGCTFLRGGHSLDFFEFYRYADNAFVYETSNRDPRIWEWDSYLCDVGRVVAGKQNIEQAIYIKPHRGAAVQRALSAVARGNRMIYWYTYGPDYYKGDSFSERPWALEETSKAAHLIGKSENALHDTEWAQPAEVALIQPFSLMTWRTQEGGTAAWEDNKWIYSALANAHIPVDPIDEYILENDDISQYKVIYLPSPNLKRDSAKKLADWVRAGGTLVTTAAGLSRDEANQPMEILAPVLGLSHRNDLQTWFKVSAYGSGRLQLYPKDTATPEGAVVTASQLYDKTPLKLSVGREVLSPDPGAEVLARYADGGVASIVNSYGKGKAYVNGFFPGLEYSIPLRQTVYNMDTDVSDATRSFVVAPVQAAGVRPVVWASAPQVEGVLLKNKKSGALCVPLMNWGYRIKPEAEGGGRELVAQRNLTIAIRGANDVKEVHSVWLDKELPITVKGDVIQVTLPELQEGDVLLLK